ncbi:Chlorophyllase, partial [Gilliamella apicola SCGC AB-598-B02]
DTNTQLESGYLQQFLAKSSSTYITIPDAMHFSFIQMCKTNAIEILNQEKQGEGIICKDGGIRQRSEIHSEITHLVVNFLSDIFSNNKN